MSVEELLLIILYIIRWLDFLKVSLTTFILSEKK